MQEEIAAPMASASAAAAAPPTQNFCVALAGAAAGTVTEPEEACAGDAPLAALATAGTGSRHWLRCGNTGPNCLAEASADARERPESCSRFSRARSARMSAADW